MELIVKITKYLLLFISALILLFFINQIIQFSLFLNRLHPHAEIYFLLIISTLAIAFSITVYYKIKKIPKALEKPDFDNAEALENYKKEIIKRLNNNALLQANGLYPESDEDIAEAITLMDKEAEKIILDNASWVFVSTAISQNGKLDGLITLFIQLKMIYKISKIYYQKPHFRELYKLYSNVIVTIFLITQIEEINIAEHLEPIISKFSPAKILAGIPGVGQSIGLLTNMLFEGSANCFLTLRIGLITKEYCNFMNNADNNSIRKNCTKQSAKLLGKIISTNSGKITKAFVKSVKNISKKTVKSTSSRIKEIVTSQVSKIKGK